MSEPTALEQLIALCAANESLADAFDRTAVDGDTPDDRLIANLQGRFHRGFAVGVAEAVRLLKKEAER